MTLNEKINLKHKLPLLGVACTAQEACEVAWFYNGVPAIHLAQSPYNIGAWRHSILGQEGEK